MAQDNPTWGQARVAAELSVKLGIYVSPRTVRAYWPPEPERRGNGRTSSQNWRTFVRNHAQSIVACDFLVVVTARFRTLYATSSSRPLDCGCCARRYERQTFLRPRLQGRGSRSARRSLSRIPVGKDRGVKERKSSVDTPLSLRFPNFCWWLYGWDRQYLSFATRRTSWGKNSLVSIGTKFISCTGSNPTFTAPFCQTNDLYIKVKRMVYLSDRSDFKAGQNYCAAQGGLCIPPFPCVLPISNSARRRRS
jgi:hypothetical protein